ncbi:plastocyanin [Hydrogenophaga crassostreae]|uniref:Plastocyanin n=1 Tax=Hydrogenophaga crassostreae TaxID=1763535 RepID=A0A162YWN7_9BURK|nr:plastocyanin [Hydrogenophaga crassostreae]OAD40645.1 plastocyanin [Hydrogenophaga crassostreae]
MTMIRKFSPLLLSLSLVGAVPAWAHGEETHVKAAVPMKMEQKPWGIGGQAKDVKRTIEIKMLDSMRFTPDHIEVSQGDTVRLTMTNTGAVMHEMVLGTQVDLNEHAALMKRFPNMEHDEPYMAHVPPGKTGDIIWTFNRPGDFDFACLLPGHFEAGMVGKIVVKPSNGAKK